MLPLRLQHLSVGIKRGQNRRCLPASYACQHRLHFFEAPLFPLRLGLSSGRKLRQLFQFVLGRTALGLGQRCVDRLNPAQPCTWNRPTSRAAF